MDGRMSMYVLLVCIWCSLDAGRLLMVVTAQPSMAPAVPTVSAVILTPEIDRREGGQVDMRCVAMNLESDHIVEWRSTHPNTTLRWNDFTITTSTRFMFSTTYPQSGMVVQDFTITSLQIDDYGEYICNARYPTTGGGHIVTSTSSVILSAPSYPICSPSGPITVGTGTELQLRCLSPSSYPWTSSSVDGTKTPSLNFTVTAAVDGVAFNCSVLQGSGADTMTRSCIIGPIFTTNAITSISPKTTPTPPNINQTPSCSQWIAAFVVTIILFSLSIIVNTLGVFQIFKMRRLIKSLRKTEASQVPKADPYMELQPTEDKNKVYMEPTTATSTITQDTYYQPVGEETDSPEYDYARPGGSTSTDYEAVSRPQSSATRP